MAIDRNYHEAAQGRGEDKRGVDTLFGPLNFMFDVGGFCTTWITTASYIVLAGRKLEALSQYIDLEDFDEDELSGLTEQMAAFYDEINKAGINVKQDPEMIEAVRGDEKGPVSNAVANVRAAMDLEDPLDILMAFSQDPLKRVDKLLDLLTKVSRDLEIVKRETASRRTKISPSNGREGTYAAQRVVIEADVSAVENWE